MAAGVKIWPSRLATSHHLVSAPLRRTPRASASSPFKVSISFSKHTLPSLHVMSVSPRGASTSARNRCGAISR